MENKNSLLHSVLNALNGIIVGIRTHRNFKIMLVIAAVVIGMGFYFHINRFEWAMIWICISVVLCLELMNSAIEELLNHLHPDRHPAIGRAKDIAAGAVLLASLISAIVGLYIFLPHWVY
jgi:undecaprenol kinase